MKHTGPISGIAAYRSDYVLTAGYDNRVILWDQRNHRALTQVAHDHLANQVSFSPEGTFAVTSSSDYGARLWTIPDLRLVAVLADHEDDVEMSAFHPTRQLIATASRDHRVRVYDFSGRLVQEFKGHGADVISVEWTADGEELISSSDDGTIKRWSLAAGTMVADIDMDGVETDTIALASSGTIYAGNDEGEIAIILGENRSSLKAHAAGIKRLVLDEHRGLLVSLSYDRLMRLWDTTGPELVLRSSTSLPPDVWPRSCAFAGERSIVFATFGSTYRSYDYVDSVWDEETVEPTYGVNAVLGCSDGSVRSVGDAGIVWADGRPEAELGSLCNFLLEEAGTVFTGGQLGRVFDATRQRVIHQHRSPLNCAVAVGVDGRRQIIVGTYTGEGLLFDVSGGDELPTLLDELRFSANAIKGLASSGGLVMGVSADASATWFRRSDFTQVQTIRLAHDKIANGCAGLGGGWFASISRDLKLRLWDPQQDVTVLDTPHTHSIKCVTASDDGNLVATGDYYGFVAVFDRRSQEWVYCRRLTNRGISSVSYWDTEGVFLASSYDGRVYALRIDDVADAGDSARYDGLGSADRPAEVGPELVLVR